MLMDYREAAQELINAESAAAALLPLTDRYPELNLDEAYRIQMEGVLIKKSRGCKVIGKKIGLTSKGMQELLGVSEPDYGHLFDYMLLGQGMPCRSGELIRPRVEGEIAFILQDRLKGPGVNIADVYRAAAGVMPAFEIVDSRIRDWKIKLADTVADNASSARLVLGNRMVPAREVDLRLIGMVLEKNGEIINSGAGANVWGHPAAAVAWLANKLSNYDMALEPGDIVLSGAVTAALDAFAGDVFTVSFHTLGTLSLKFV